VGDPLDHLGGEAAAVRLDKELLRPYGIEDEYRPAIDPLLDLPAGQGKHRFDRDLLPHGVRQLRAKHFASVVSFWTGMG